jgi:hypothetical protein
MFISNLKNLNNKISIPLSGIFISNSGNLTIDYLYKAYRSGGCKQRSRSNAIYR